jgi:hypothetical protein
LKKKPVRPHKIVAPKDCGSHSKVIARLVLPFRSSRAILVL